MSYHQTLAENIRAYPDKTAIEFIDFEAHHAPASASQRLTYGEFGDRVRRTMRYLHNLGMQPGDRVALQLPKGLEFILLHFATLQSGGISLPLNPAYPPDETEYFLADSGARLFFADRSAAARLAPILRASPTGANPAPAPARLPELQECVTIDTAHPERFAEQIVQLPPLAAAPTDLHPDDTAVIIYTSGTTGRPKGAEITHGNLTANLEALHTAWGWQPDDILLHVLPIFHVHGLFVALHGALHAGATALLMRSFDPRQTLETLVARQCTVFMAVPTIHHRLLAAASANAGKFDLSRLRLITSGSDRLPDEVFLGFQRSFGYTLLERYGMSEAGMCLSNPLHGERRVGSVGLPLPGVQVRVVDPETGAVLPDGQVGEIQIRGPNVLKGYWRQAEKTAAAFTPDGWFRSGDLGLRQPDGYFILHGRAKDLIISGGMNIYPPEVERVLAEHPAVAASAVIGCPDPEWGERVVAVVVSQGSVPPAAEDLIAFCRERLAPYKCPKAVLYRQDLPRNAMGKIQKGALRAEVCLEME